MFQIRIRRFLTLVCALALVFSGVSVSRAEGKKVTVMVYMCGSNLESRNNQGTQALGEMIRSRFSAENVNVAVLAGGSRTWSNGFDPGMLTLGELGNGRRIQKTEYPLAAMGDAETLSFFLNECAQRFPAEQNILIFWDHGGGPAHGVCQDELFEGDTLSLQEISDALAGSPFADHGLDLIVFNACLMGSAELSTAMEPFAKYLIATEDSMYGLTYEWLNGAESRTPLENAKKIADDSFAFNQQVIEAQHASEINSFSVVDLSKAKALSDAVDAFFAHVTPDLNAGSFTAMSAQRRDSVTFGIGESGNASGFDLVDLGDLVKHYREIAPAEADALLAALNEAVVHHRSDREECTGLTVYHPFENKARDLLMYRIAVYNGLGFAPAYTAYIQSFAAMLTGTPMADWTGLRIAASAKKDQRTLYTMPLTEDQAAHFGSASLTAMLKTGDGTYAFTWAGGNFAPDADGVLTAEYVHNFLCVTNAEGEAVFTPLPYTRDARGHYLIPAELTRHEKETEDGVLPEVTEQALITCAYDASTRRMDPGGVLIREDSMGGYTPAYNAVFSDYDEIRITVPYRAETRGEDGVTLPFDQWTVSTEEVFESAIDGSWSFSLLPDLFEPADIVVAFDVADSQNNHYLSSLLPVGAAPQEATIVTEYDDANLVVLKSLTLNVANGSLNMNLSPENITDQETVIILKNLTLNGRDVGFSAEGYGSGENWGLIPGESTLLFCMLPLDSLSGIGTLTEITFELTVKDAATDEKIGTVPVKVKTELELAAAP